MQDKDYDSCTYCLIMYKIMLTAFFPFFPISSSLVGGVSMALTALTSLIEWNIPSVYFFECYQRCYRFMFKDSTKMVNHCKLCFKKIVTFLGVLFWLYGNSNSTFKCQFRTILHSKADRIFQEFLP